MIGTSEWIVIGIVVVLIFGSSAVIKWARALGKAKGEFNKATKEFENPTEDTKEDE